MKRHLVLLPTALLTFAIGVLLGSLWLRHNRAVPPLAKTETKITTPNPDAAALTFTGGETVEAFQLWYQSSDGETVSYMNLDWESPVRAARELRNESLHMHIVERIPNFNGLGERRVVTTLPDWGTRSQVLWTEGSHLFIINASDVRHALAFEESRLWADTTYSVRPIPIRRMLQEEMSRMKALPNKLRIVVARSRDKIRG